MGNRVYFTLKDKNTSKTYYQHWNGGLDTFCPIIDSAFQNNVTESKDVVSFLESCELNPELMKDISPTTCEENGHYIIDLNKKTFIQYYEQYVKLDNNTYAEIRVRPLSDLKQAFEDYLLSSIRIECHNDVRQSYWYGFKQKADDYFKALNPLNNKQTQSEVDEFIKESPYSLTAKEKTYIKRKLKQLNTSSYTIEASLTSRSNTIKVLINDMSLIDIDDTREQTRRYSSNTETVLPQLKKDISEKIKASINAIMSQHQVTYSERDLMIDHYGSYRIKYVHIEFKYSDDIKQKTSIILRGEK